jgi:hypothetical protein
MPNANEIHIDISFVGEFFKNQCNSSYNACSMTPIGEQLTLGQTIGMSMVILSIASYAKQ